MATTLQAQDAVTGGGMGIVQGHAARIFLLDGEREIDITESLRFNPLVLALVLTPGNFHRLARRSGLSRSTVSGVLQGKRGASLETLRRLSEASGVELGKLTEYVESQRRQRQ